MKLRWGINSWGINHHFETSMVSDVLCFNCVNGELHGLYRVAILLVSELKMGKLLNIVHC